MNKLKKYLQDNNLSVKNFTIFLNNQYHISMPEITVRCWVSGKRRPTPEKAYLIQKATGGEVSLEDLLLPPSAVEKIEAFIANNEISERLVGGKT